MGGFEATSATPRNEGTFRRDSKEGSLIQVYLGVHWHFPLMIVPVPSGLNSAAATNLTLSTASPSIPKVGTLVADVLSFQSSNEPWLEQVGMPCSTIAIIPKRD